MTERSQHLDDWTLEALAEGMVGDMERRTALAHLEACARCTAELEGYRALFAAIGDLPRLAPSPQFGDAVMARVRIPQPSPLLAWLQRWAPATRRGWVLLVAALVAPVLPVIAAVGWVLSRPAVSVGSLWQQAAGGATSTAGAALDRIFQWGIDSGAFSRVQSVIDAVQGVPLETLAAVLMIFAVAIPLSAWSLFRLLRTPMGSATYAN